MELRDCPRGWQAVQGRCRPRKSENAERQVVTTNRGRAYAAAHLNRSERIEMKHTVKEVKAKILRFRKDYHAGRLSAYQIEQLEAIPGWTWDVDAPIPEPKTPSR